MRGSGGNGGRSLRPRGEREVLLQPVQAATLTAHMQAVMGRGEVDVRLKELLSIRVSHINDCEY